MGAKTKVRWTEGQKRKFVERVKRFRERYGVSQEKLGEEMGISRREVVNIENGHHIPMEVVVIRYEQIEEKYQKGEEIKQKLTWVPQKEGKDI